MIYPQRGGSLRSSAFGTMIMTVRTRTSMPPVRRDGSYRPPILSRKLELDLNALFGQVAHPRGHGLLGGPRRCLTRGARLPILHAGSACALLVLLCREAYLQFRQ